MGTLRRYVKGQVLDPSRSRGMTVIQRSRLGASTTHLGVGEELPGAARSFDSHEERFQLGSRFGRICDRVNGPRSGLCEDFIEMEKGLGTLRRYVKGQVLDPSRSRGMTVIQRSRLGGSATHLGRGDRAPGPARSFDSHEERFQLGSRLRRILHRRMFHLRQGERPQVWPIRRFH